MGKVLKVDASLDEAWVDQDLGSNQSELWATFSLAFDAAALAFWSGSSSGLFVNLFKVAHDDSASWDSIFYDGLWEGWANSATPAPVADTWQVCELHYESAVTSEFYVDGVLAFTGTPSPAGLIRFARFGQDNANNDPAAICYLDDIKIGTTRGGTELFADGFESGDVSAWDTSYGDVSVIDDPFAASPSVGSQSVRILVAFTDDTLTESPDFTDLAAP